MNAIYQRKLARALTAACCTLAVVVALELLYAREAPNIERGDFTPQQALPAPESLPSFAARPLTEFSEILTRPLFYEDRRLPVAPAQLPEQERLEPLRLTLEGVAIGGGARVAVLRDERDRVQIRLAEGMAHNGWILESVQSAGAEFRRGADVTTLELEVGEDARRRRR